MSGTQKVSPQHVNSNTYLYALADARRYLAASERTVAQLRERLDEQGHCTADIATVVEHLLDERALDDTAYAERFVEKHLQQRLQALAVVQEELRVLGIADHVVEQVTAPFNSEVEEAHRAWQLLERQWSRWSHLPVELLLRRVSSYLARRGYPAHVVDDVCNRCEQRASQKDIE